VPHAGVYHTNQPNGNIAADTPEYHGRNEKKFTALKKAKNSGN